MMKRIHGFLFLFAFLPAIAQTITEDARKIDSLKLIVSDAKHDTIKINALLEWDNIIYLSDAKLDLKLNEEIKKLCERGLEKQAGTKEKTFYSKMLSKSLNNIGNYYDTKGDVPKAINFYTQSLKIDEENGNKNGMATSLNNIGNIYSDQGENSKALDYYNRSIKIREEINDKQGLGMTLNNISNIYHVMGDNARALDYSFRSLKMREEAGNKKGASISLNNIGSIYSEQRDYTKALEYHLRSIVLKEEIGDKAGIAVCYLNMGIAYSKLGNLNKGMEFTQKALDISRELGLITTTENASLALYESYKNLGKFREALEMYELTVRSRDSIVSEENQKEVMRAEMQYNYEKQKALDEKEQEKTIAISAEQEKKQKVISWSIAAGLLLVLLFSIFVVNRLRITRSQKLIIEEQKQQVEEKQKEILDSINYAKRLQEAILPPKNFIKKFLPDCFILYKPKDIVAGDFYWMEIVSQKFGAGSGEKKSIDLRADEVDSKKEQISHGRKLKNSHNHRDTDPDSELILIAAADCTGHGVPGAMVSVVCSNALNRTTLEFGITDPGEILDKTRELVLETFSKSDKDVKDGMDISLVSISGSKEKGYEIKWAGANNPLWYITSGEIHELNPDKQAIGKTENPRPFKTNVLYLKNGDILFLFTDGFADQFGGEKGKKFKSKQLKELLFKNSTHSSEIQKEKLEIAFESWKSNLEQIDDVCIIGVRL